jgi:hypothetical protein
VPLLTIKNTPSLVPICPGLEKAKEEDVSEQEREDGGMGSGLLLQGDDGMNGPTMCAWSEIDRQVANNRSSLNSTSRLQHSQHLYSQ